MKKIERRPDKLQQAWLGYVFILPAFLVLTLMVVYPLIYGMVISLFDTNLVNKFKFVGLKYYGRLIKGASFYASILRTLFFTVCVVAGRAILGLFFSITLVRKDIPCRTLFRTILVLPWFFPDVVIGLLWKWLYNANFGLFNYILSSLHLISQPVEFLSSQSTAMLAVIVVCIWKGYPYIMVMLLAALQTIPADLYEAAELDGCNKWQQFCHVTFPGILPVFATTIMLEFMWCFKHFTLIWNLTYGGPVDATRVVSIDIYKAGFESMRFGESSARAVIVFAIIIVMTLLQRKAKKVLSKE